MPKELPYLPSYKNVATLFQRIDAAKRPESLSTRVLAETFGLKASGDRPLITLLKTLGFLDPSGRPTAQYDLLKNPQLAPRAIAEGVRKAYKPLFDANENAHALTAEHLRGLISQVAGADKGVASKIAGTFTSLVRLGDFSEGASQNGRDDDEDEDEAEDEDEQEWDDDAEDDDEVTTSRLKRRKPRRKVGMRHEFHYNIQVHLPSNASEETYLLIFNAIRKTFR